MTFDDHLRALLRTEGERFTPSSDPAVLAATLHDGEHAEIVRGRVHPAERTWRHPGIGPLSIAAAVLLLVATGTGIWVATRGATGSGARVHASGHPGRGTGGGPRGGSTTTVPWKHSSSTTTSLAVHLPAPSLDPSNDPRTVPALLPSGRTLSRTAVAWTAVGAGWQLYLDDDVRCGCGWDGSERGPEGSGWDALVLVSPSGARYVIDHWPVSAVQHWTLLDWSGATDRALLSGVESSDQGSGPPVEVEIDLRTGAVTSLPMTDVTGFAPNGTDLFANPPWLNEATLVTPANRTLAVLERGSGSYAHAVAGGTVVGNDSSLQYVTASGTRVAISPSGEDCTYVRQWSAGSVLESCGEAVLWIEALDGSGGRLVGLPAATVRGGLLIGTAAETGIPYELPTGTYVTEAGGCSSTFVGKQVGTSITLIVPPGEPISASVRFIGQVGDDLLASVSSGCTSPQLVELFDTATGSWRTLFGSPAREVGFGSNVLVAPAFRQ